MISKELIARINAKTTAEDLAKYWHFDSVQYELSAMNGADHTAASAAGSTRHRLSRSHRTPDWRECRPSAASKCRNCPCPADPPGRASRAGRRHAP